LRTIRFGAGSTRASPVLEVDGVFTILANEAPTIYSADIDLGAYSFQAYGYWSEAARVTKSLMTFRDTLFKGEIVIVARGKEVPILLRPRMKKAIIEQAVLL